MPPSTQPAIGSGVTLTLPLRPKSQWLGDHCGHYPDWRDSLDQLMKVEIGKEKKTLAV